MSCYVGEAHVSRNRRPLVDSQEGTGALSPSVHSHLSERGSTSCLTWVFRWDSSPSQHFGCSFWEMLSRRSIPGHHLLLWSMPYSCLSLGPLWWASSHQLLSSLSCSNYPVRPVSQTYYYTGLLSGYQAQSRPLLKLTCLAPVLLSGRYPEKPVLFESIDLMDEMYPGRL